MAGNCILGIDVGTTTVKAGVLDENGVMIDLFAETYPTTRKDGNRVEQDPNDWMIRVTHAINRFAEYDIRAIGLCSQVNTHVFVDGKGAPLAPAILWQDGRAASEAAEIDAGLTEAQKIAWWVAPMPIDASHAIARMAWMARHQPLIWQKTCWVMLPKDYCLFELTGRASTDPLSNIGLVGQDLRYIEEVQRLVPGGADRLAPLVGPIEVAGHVSGGPLKGVPVVSGTMDAWAGLVGTGGARDRATVYLSGTSEILGISSQNVVPTPGAIVFPACEGVRLHAAPTQNGGDAKMWFTQLAGLSPSAMAAMVRKTPRSAATPLFLPQLEGERAPLWDVDLRAAFLGITRQTRMPDFARAVYEGVAFAARQALDLLLISSTVTSDEIFCAGGGFRSAPWAQIRADVMGVPLRPLLAGEPGILGAATLASLGIDGHRSIADANEALAVYGPTVYPDPAQHKIYNELFEIYTDAIAAHADIGKRLSSLHA